MPAIIRFQNSNVIAGAHEFGSPATDPDKILQVRINGIAYKRGEMSVGTASVDLYYYQRLMQNLSSALAPTEFITKIYDVTTTSRTIRYKIGSTVTPGYVYTFKLSSQTASYTVLSGDTTSDVRDNLVGEINSIGWSGTTVTVTAIGADTIQCVFSNVNAQFVTNIVQTGISTKFKDGYFYQWNGFTYVWVSAESATGYVGPTYSTPIYLATSLNVAFDLWTWLNSPGYTEISRNILFEGTYTLADVPDYTTLVGDNLWAPSPVTPGNIAIGEPLNIGDYMEVLYK